MATVTLNGGSLTSFKGKDAKVFVTSEDDEFDVETLRAWQGEGFDVKYIPLAQGGSKYVKVLQSLGDSIGVGGSFAIVGINPLRSLPTPP